MAPNTAWEWMEQYGAVQIDESELELSHEERAARLTDKLIEKKVPVQIEEKLRASKVTALQKAELLIPGSGYGVLGVHGKLTSHLEFMDKSGEYSRWKAFVEGGKMMCPAPLDQPDAFLDDADSFARLKEAVKNEEKENWYAHYHLGIRYYALEKYKKAKREFEMSLELKENAWAYHGLSCIYLLRGKNKKAIHCMKRGIELQNEKLSYIKEGFRILIAGKGYEELCSLYEKLNQELQNNSRLKFYHIKALAELGKTKKAFKLLEENGGLVLDDVREGEDSLAEIWTSLYEKIYKERKEIPYQFQFNAFE